MWLITWCTTSTYIQQQLINLFRLFNVEFYSWIH